MNHQRYYSCTGRTGDADDLIKQAKEIIMQTATYQNLTCNTRRPTFAAAKKVK